MNVTFSVSKTVNGSKVVLAESLEHTLDFSKCSEAEILELASKTIVIKLQGIMRELSKVEVQAEHGKTTDVHELINRPTVRKPADPVKAVLNKDMSEEELADLIAKLQAKIAN